MLFYSQGLPSLFIAGFSVHSVTFCSCFIFLHTLNVLSITEMPCFASFLWSCGCEAELQQQIVVYAVHIPLVFICFFFYYCHSLWKKCLVAVCVGKKQPCSTRGVCVSFTHLHNESGIITCLHCVLLFSSLCYITRSAPHTVCSVCDAKCTSRVCTSGLFVQ